MARATKTDAAPSADYLRALALADLPPGAAKPVTVRGIRMALFNVDGVVHAAQLLCPHMAYPLTKGTIADNILTCHWHHARFELLSGGSFSAWCDDLPVYPVEVRNGDIFVCPEPKAAYHRDLVPKNFTELRKGMEDTSTFRIAKSVTGLLAAGVAPLDILRRAAELNLFFAENGVSNGLVGLACVTNLLPHLSEDDRPLALIHGVRSAAGPVGEGPPRRTHLPLPEAEGLDFPRLKRYYRALLDDREAEGAERCLRTAVAQGLAPEAVAEMCIAAATDHFFLNGGHTLDFINKAFELADALGDAQRADLIAGLAAPTAQARREEENLEWAEVAGPLWEVHHDLPELLAAGRGKPWNQTEKILDVLLNAKPLEIVEYLRLAISRGATVTQLTHLLARAGVWRMVRMHLQNEEDWDIVHECLSHNNALDRLAQRLAGRGGEAEADLMRGVFHAAVFTGLCYFMNLPAAKLPSERPAPAGDPDKLLTELQRCAEFQRVEEGAGVVFAYLSQGHDRAALLQKLGYCLLFEDAGFHSLQSLEAGIRQFHALGDQPEAALALVGAARFIFSRKLQRNVLFQTRNAEKLLRGESLADAPD